MVTVDKITYKEISVYWKLLWSYPFRPRSAVRLLNWKDKDLSLISNDSIKVTFLGAFKDGKIVGVNSGFCPCDDQYRSRGLYVLPEYRRCGIGYELLRATEDQGRKEGKTLLWTVPRDTAWSAYKRYGFKRVSEFFQIVSLHLHCYAVKIIR